MSTLIFYDKIISMKKILLTAIIIFFCSVRAFAIEDCGCEHHHHLEGGVEIKDGSVLTIRDCISTGIKNSPVIKEYAYRLEIAKSNVGIAKSAYFPEFGAGLGYKQELNSNKNEFFRNYRELPTIGISLNKMIWDFGKTTANIKMEEFLKIAAEYEFEDIVCQTVFEIKSYYYNLLKAKSEFEAQCLSYAIQKQIVNKIKSLVKEGKKDKADLLNAQLILFKVNLEYNNAERNYKNAKEELNNAMYLDNPPKYSIYETQTFLYNPVMQTSFKNIPIQKRAKISEDDTIFQHPKFTYNDAVSIAYKNSPDIKALVSTKNAFEQALIFVKRSYYPELNAGVGYDFLNSNKFNNNGLSVAVTIDSTINGMRQKYDLKGAKAQLDLADTEIETFKKDLYFTVRKCINDVDSTYKNLSPSRDEMKKAAEYFDLTYENYLKDIMYQLDLEDARWLYVESLIDYINSQFVYNIALIQLEMSMHEHLIDYHDDAEHVADYHEGDENNALSKLIRCGKKHKP